MSVVDAPRREREESFMEPGGREKLQRRAIYRAALAYGRFIAKFRWLILAIWLVIVVASVFFMISTIKLLGTGNARVGGSESAQVETLLKDSFGRNASQVLIALQSPSLAVSDPAYQQEITDLQTKLRALPEVQNVTLASPGADGKTTLLIVGSRANKDLQVSELRHILETTHGPAQTYLTGGPAISDEITQTSLENVEHADLLALPIALLILIVVFGTFIAACLPLILVGVAIPLTLALLYPVALHEPTSTYVLSVASIVGLGIAIDYSLFILRRFREELALGLSVGEAIGWTLATAGEAILFSGLIVMIGFLGLLLIGTSMTTSIGVAGAFLVISTILAALTFLPALLCVLGLRINAWRVPYLWRVTMGVDHRQAGKQELFWRAVATRVMKHPLVTLGLVCAILLALGWPILSMRVGATGVKSLPTEAESRQGMEVLSAQYPAFNYQTIDLVVETTDQADVLNSGNLERLADLTAWLKAQPHVKDVTGLMSPPSSPGATQLSRDQLIALYTSGAYQQDPALASFVKQYSAGNMAYVTLSSDAASSSDDANNQITDLRAHASDAVAGLKVLVGGEQASNLDFDNLLFGHFAWTICFVLLATLVLLMIMFRSLLLPLKAVIMNIISISASYGVLVLVFQWGHLSNILGFTSTGYVNNVIPIILFCVLFGLSMDYEVFLLSRMREEWLRTGDNRQAIALGLEKTGSVITNAALLFIVVTVAFAFTSELETKQMGVGMTTSILIDATIIRSLLVPATMRLLGRLNWWFPGRKLAPKPQVTVPEELPQTVEV